MIAPSARAALAAASLLVSLGACSSGSSAPSAAPSSVTQTIDAKGGQIVVDGATVTFAANALATAQTITITASSDPPPPGFVALSKVYTCSPSGLNFTAPVTMAMTYKPDGNPVTIFWSSAASPSFAPLQGASIAASTVTANIGHFSSGFVGRAK